jgi:hypothetical protein
LGSVLRIVQDGSCNVGLPRNVKGLFENLGLHGLAAQQAFQFTHLPLQLADTAGADNIFVSGNRPAGPLRAFTVAN